MNISTKLLKAAAGSAGGAGLDVDEVFSTFLYFGTNDHDNAINNGIDLSGEGGLVWIKSRDVARNHALYDTERGVNKYISSNTNSGNTDLSSSSDQGLKAFNSNGFTVDDNELVNANDPGLVSWTFRKASKFFDIVTYTGNGSNRTISHNLGSAPGMIIVKRTDGLKDWAVYHRGRGNTHYGTLNTTEAFYDNNTWWNDTDPTSTEFSVGTSAFTNNSGHTYVAYLFAHNNSDGGFGPNGDQDVIKCGSYTGNGADDGPTVDLGFEPQFIFLKRADSTSQWNIVDTMRGLVTGGSDIRLYPNLTNTDDGFDFIEVTSTGFKITTSATAYNANSGTFIYMAIRRGPLAEPTSSSDVFAIDTVGASSGNQPAFKSNFVTDHMIAKVPNSSGNWISNSRLVGTKYMSTNLTSAEANDNNMTWDFQDGVWNVGSGGSYTAWMWKRAPGYFDVVCFKGNGGGARNITHNLGSAPGMLWLKRRDGSSPYGDWYVQHTSIAASEYITLNTNSAKTSSPDSWNSTYASSDVFRVGSDNNVSNYEYIVYLFGTVAGVSKVGSFTGATSDVTVDCGFSNGANFVIIKDTNASGDWYVYDVGRGINAGNEGYLELNTTNADNTGADYIDPHSSGFIITSGFMQSGRTYIFYAIAA